MPIAAHNVAEIFAGNDVKTPGLYKLFISRYRTNAFGYEIWDRLYDGSVQLQSRILQSPNLSGVSCICDVHWRLDIISLKWHLQFWISLTCPSGRVVPNLTCSDENQLVLFLFCFFIASKLSLRRLCFYTCLSFCSQGGVCLSACWDTHTHPPWTDTSPRADTPLHSACWEILATSGQYAS